MWNAPDSVVVLAVGHERVSAENNRENTGYLRRSSIPRREFQGKIDVPAYV
jgi:hypothetical protein